MAAADYRQCDVCDSKTFYDADLPFEIKDGEWVLSNVGDWAVICVSCAQTHEVRIIRKEASCQS